MSKRLTIFPLVLLTSSLICVCNGANILFYYGVATHSHRVQIEPLLHKLVELGHNVTFLGAIKPIKPNPGIIEFNPTGFMKLHNRMLTGIGDEGFPSRLQDKYSNFMIRYDTLILFVDTACQALFDSAEDVQPWMESAKFDLVVLGHAANKCGLGLAHKFNASVIVSSANTFFSDEEDFYGFPAENSWLRRFQITNVFTTTMSFYDRVYNVLSGLYFHLFATLDIAKNDEPLREFMGIPDLPSIEEMDKKSSLMLINQHYSDDYARSLPPFIVPVGGMHCTQTNGTLPKEMQDFIAGAGEHGFIYVSFGSLVKMSKVPKVLLNVFFDAVRNLKVRFLWRWDADPPSNLPKNIFTSKWLPQQDVLAHPKIKGFVSQGGLMSLQEAIFHGVPMIVLPIVFDQPFNAHKVATHQIGIHLELSELTAQNFKEALMKLTQDKTIISNMKERSRDFKDRPMSPVDTAAWWVEYTLRHKDNISHMKPLGIHQTWWQRRLLDVWATIFAVILLSTFLAFKIVFYMLKITFSRFIEGPTKAKSSKLKSN